MNCSRSVLKSFVVLSLLLAFCIAVEPTCDSKWKRVWAGNYVSFALQTDDTLKSFGMNVMGQSGVDDQLSDNISAPTDVKAGSKWLWITSSDFYAFGILSDGTLWGWGMNPIGFDNGIDSLSPSHKPIQIGTDKDWAQVSSNGYHTLALKQNGSLYAWGDNKASQVGDGATADVLTPKLVLPAKKWLNISAGLQHSVAILDDGTLWGWGNNTFGQLGDGTVVSKSVPTQIGTAKWKAVSAGARHTLAIDTNGKLHTWGENSAGTLGDGTKVDKHVPTLIGEATWSKITASNKFSFGIMTNGSLFGWGANAGNLGDGTHTDRLIPVPIGQGQLWKDVSAGIDYVLALNQAGILFSWGFNLYDNLGFKTTTSIHFYTSPVVCGDTNVCYRSKCQAICPSKTFINTGFCEACNDTCAECSGNPTNCTKCQPKAFLTNNNGTGTCSPCDSNCLVCQNSSKTCLECHPGEYLDRSTRTCSKSCHTDCATCSVYTDHCTTCKAGEYLHNNTCVKTCLSNCSTCSGTATTCTSCSAGWYLSAAQCHSCVEGCINCTNASCSHCLDGYYLTPSKTCVKCDSHCTKCSGFPSNCVCENGLHYNSQTQKCESVCTGFLCPKPLIIAGVVLLVIGAIIGYCIYQKKQSTAAMERSINTNIEVPMTKY